MRHWIAVLAALIPAGVAFAADVIPPADERVFLTVTQALKETFPAAVRFDEEIFVLGDSARAVLEKRLGGTVADDSITVFRAIASDGPGLGFAVVSEEIGKYYPITFMVGVTPELKIARVSVLVYRESHGGDVRRERFLNQYRGKTLESPIRANQDIINISGATLSVRSLNYGVRKVLGLLQELINTGTGDTLK